MTTFEELSPEMLDKVNENPKLLSFLYDINLLPEQVTTKERAVILRIIVEAYSLGTAEVTPKVKPLVFSKRGDELPDGARLAADCPFGRYFIASRGEYGFGWKRAGAYVFAGLRSTEAKAIADAQADYERRILSVLE